jgi:hypothetical protein
MTSRGEELMRRFLLHVLTVTPGQWRNTLLGEVARNDLTLAIQDRLTYPK